MASLIYQPITINDEIRIISLLPHGGDPDAPIHCRFEHVRLEQRPQYEALSYTWGDQSIQHPIIVDAFGNAVYVGQNCLFALRSLRRADEPRRLWIDALCINQSDLEEKTMQIPIIGDVYQSASHTIIFLQYSGPDHTFHGRGAGPELQRCWDAGDRGDEGGQPKLDEAARQELFNVENYPWFRRAWIIQETLLSFSRTVMCPPFAWSFETFTDLAPSRSDMEVIRISDDYSINRSNTGGWNHVWDGQIRQRMPGDMLPMSLLDYLVDTRNFQCKQYHDRVYSILSLFNPQLSITVDYNCSKEKLHEKLSGALIEAGDSRPLLTTHRKSWRVNWDEALGDLTGDEVRYIGMSRAMLLLSNESRWAGLGYVARSRSEPGSLRVLSFKIGEVTKISRTKLGSEATDAKVIKRRWDDIMAELDLPVKEKESGAWPAIHLQKRNRANAPWYRAWIRIKGKKADEEEVGGPEEKPRGNFYSSSAAFFRGRPLFLCENEGVVGIGTHDLQVGDEIWYICGLNVPVCALRRNPKPEFSSTKDKFLQDATAMVGLCFLGVNNDIKAVGPMDKVFPHDGMKYVCIV